MSDAVCILSDKIEIKKRMPIAVPIITTMRGLGLAFRTLSDSPSKL